MANDKQPNINDWIAQREKEIENDKNNNSNFIRLAIGENKIKLLAIPAQKIVGGKFGDRWHYKVDAEGKEKILSASVVLDRMLVEAMKEGIFEITLIKVGEGKSTRYSIKELA